MSQEFIADGVTCAKRDLAEGECLDGEGGYTVFGKLMPTRESLSLRAIPVALASAARLTKPAVRDRVLRFDDVELPPHNLLLQLRRELTTGLRLR